MPVTSDKGRARSNKKPGRKMKVNKKTVKRGSARAAALATPLFRKRVVKSAKAYSRKRKARAQGEASEDA
jgi:stalled ribosome alternative rescue factor ArfA